jgi:hypothetical protein
MTTTVVLNHAWRSRSFGAGYTVDKMLTDFQTGKARPVVGPVHTGTIQQVQSKLQADPLLMIARNNKLSYCLDWFYKGQRVEAINGMPFSKWLEEERRTRTLAENSHLIDRRLHMQHRPVTLTLEETK